MKTKGNNVTGISGTSPARGCWWLRRAFPCGWGRASSIATLLTHPLDLGWLRDYTWNSFTRPLTYEIAKVHLSQPSLEGVHPWSE